MVIHVLPHLSHCADKYSLPLLVVKNSMSIDPQAHGNWLVTLLMGCLISVAAAPVVPPGSAAANAWAKLFAPTNSFWSRLVSSRVDSCSRWIDCCILGVMISRCICLV